MFSVQDKQLPDLLTKNLKGQVDITQGIFMGLRVQMIVFTFTQAHRQLFLLVESLSSLKDFPQT